MSTTRPDVIAPTVHLNGTSGEDLKQQLCDALGALRAAREALRQTAPNARDYYVQDDKAFPRARDQYYARLAKLGEIQTELETIAEIVCNQVDARERQRRSRP